MTNTNPRESRLRSVLKALTWRVVATLTTGVIAFAITGRLVIAIQIASIEAGAKLFVYYFHERAWQMVPRGTVRKLYHDTETEVESDAV